MTTGRMFDSSFEKYRRERKRRRADSGPLRPQARTGVLRELEEAEQQEARNQQLTREVHDFFADATRKAAGIVTRVSEEEEHAHDGQVCVEMTEFLEDAVRRAQGLIELLQVTPNDHRGAEELRANMHNLVGSMLDEFRWEGTAQLDDKHIGQDPFSGAAATEGQAPDAPEGDAPATELAGEEVVELDHEVDPMVDVVEDPVEHVPEPDDVTPQDRSAADIEDHLVADVVETPGEPEVAMPSSEHGLSPSAAEWLEALCSDLEGLKAALKQLVHARLMTKACALAIYREVGHSAQAAR